MGKFFKISELTAKEKADQKYAIAKSYEKEGHPRKAKEYKEKAAKAYKQAFAKTASALKLNMDEFFKIALRYIEAQNNLRETKRTVDKAKYYYESLKDKNL